jgi:hypothetical protein
LVALVAGGACHPLTSIPTYWPPEIRAEVDRAPEIEPPPPAPVVAEVPKKPRPPAPIIEGPPECMSVYVVSAQNRLFAFDPQRSSFKLQGVLRCPGAGFATPFSMAVSRQGIGHVLFNNGRLFRVDVDDASCEATPFRPYQHGFALFGMGYGPSGDDGETLYVAEVGFYRQSKGLARIDTDRYELLPIGSFTDNPGYNIELTPTGRGPLHGYFINVGNRGGTLVAIDTGSGRVVRSTAIAAGSQSSSLAISWWGGDYYVFTSIAGGTEVTRYDPEASDTAVVATIEQTIVGAGVSTCAPDRQRSASAKPSKAL